MNSVQSINNVNIRLTDERWRHITEEHSELAGYFYDVLESISNPDYIYKGQNEELLAVKEILPLKSLVVIYKETNKKDGFVITAFITKRKKQLEKRELLWQK